MMTWLRLYWSALNYHKIQNVALETDEEDLFVFGTWAALLCVAGRSDPGPTGGRLLLTAGRPMTIAHLARELRVDNARLARLMESLADYGSLTFDGETWAIKNWKKYQRVGDHTAAERQRRYRERKKAKKARGQAEPEELPLPPANDDVQALMNHFTEKTGLFAPAPGAVEKWRDDWMAPAVELLMLAGHDLATAKAQMSAVLALMREKGLRYSCPRSLIKVTRRYLGERAWRLVTEEIGRVGASGEPDLTEELDDAIRRAGGWYALCTERAEQAEQRFVQAYVQGLRR